MEKYFTVKQYDNEINDYDSDYAGWSGPNTPPTEDDYARWAREADELSDEMEVPVIEHPRGDKYREDVLIKVFGR
jgi:hypothetical protein